VSAPEDEDGRNAGAWLRLYVAGDTPNSARAQENLKTALDALDGQAAALDVAIIDVFKNSRRALADGVIVTPTLIGGRRTDRLQLMGDLTDGDKLDRMLKSLTASGA
jgi:circadian clock protein KaiB